EDVVIHKPSYGAFYDTPLETILKNLGPDTILICGTLTNYCSGMTARQGYERGFKVVVGSDVCATDDPTMQEPELKVLRKGFARVLLAEELIAELGGRRAVGEGRGDHGGSGEAAVARGGPRVKKGSKGPTDVRGGQSSEWPFEAGDLGRAGGVPDP